MSTFKKSLFGIEMFGNACFEGWSDGTLWNGWDKPVFELDEAKKILEVFLDTQRETGQQVEAWYDEKDDRFCFILPHNPEPECFQAEVIKLDNGQKLKVYPIGTGAWIWEELQVSQNT